MDTKDVLHELRVKHGLSQDDLAQKVFVTRQAVSRWENGETVPNIETLKLLSRFFNVSIIIAVKPFNTDCIVKSSQKTVIYFNIYAVMHINSV